METRFNPNSVLLTAGETAKVLRISERLVWRLIAEGSIASVRIGRRRLVPREAIETFVTERMQGANGRAA